MLKCRQRALIPERAFRIPTDVAKTSRFLFLDHNRALMWMGYFWFTSNFIKTKLHTYTVIQCHGSENVFGKIYQTRTLQATMLIFGHDDTVKNISLTCLEKLRTFLN